MKKVAIIKLVIITLLFHACSFNKSINKDLITGAVTTGNDLSCDAVYMQINGETIHRNTFIFGENVNFIFNDINGFKQENGKVYPEMSMVIIKKENQMVFSELSLLNLTDGTSLSPLQLKANFIAGFPYQNNEKYEVLLTIWDTKGDGKFTYKMPFKVQENKLLTITSNNMKYSSIYLWNETENKVVTDNKIVAKNKYSLLLEGIDGLIAENKKVFPMLSILLTDNKGNMIIADQNLYSKYASGFDAITFSEKQLPITLTFKDGQFFNPYRLKVILKDEKSENKLSILTNFTIE